MRGPLLPSTPPLPPAPPQLELLSDYFERDGAYTHRRPHGSGDYLLLYTAGGAGRIVGPAGTTLTRPGDATLYAPGEAQDYGTAPAAGNWHLFWVHFTPRPTWRVWLRWPVNAQGLKLVGLGGGEIRERFERAMGDMVTLFRRPVPEAMDLAANALEAALLWARTSESQRGWGALDPRVRRAIDHLAAHLREPFCLEALARHAGLSASRLAHLFQRETGTSPRRFLETHRLQQACHLLRITNRSIAEIALDVGYSDPFYFTNRFRHFLRQSPSAFRKLDESKRGPDPAARRGT